MVQLVPYRVSTHPSQEGLLKESIPTSAPNHYTDRNRGGPSFLVQSLLRGLSGGRSGPKFLHFHVIFGENWSNNILAPPGIGAPLPFGKS